MKKVGVGVVVILALFLPSAMVSGQTEDIIEPVMEVTDPTRDADREARIEARKQQAAERLSAAQERRIANACSAAQTKVARLQTNLSQAKENRRNRYNTLTDKLDSLVTKIQDAGIATTDLEEAITSLKAQADEIITAIQDYETALADLAVMDCETDPSGFQATLQAAREQRSSIVSLTSAAKAYVQDTIKPILSDIREQLAATEGEEA